MNALHEYEVVLPETKLNDELVCTYLKNCFHIHATLNRGDDLPNIYTLRGKRISYKRVLEIIKNNGDNLLITVENKNEFLNTIVQASKK